MKITDLSILCKWKTLKNQQCIKYVFAPIYIENSRGPRTEVLLVVLHALLVIIEMTPRLNKQSGSDRTGGILTTLKPALEYLNSFVINL